MAHFLVRLFCWTLCKRFLAIFIRSIRWRVVAMARCLLRKQKAPSLFSFPFFFFFFIFLWMFFMSFNSVYFIGNLEKYWGKKYMTERIKVQKSREIIVRRLGEKRMRPREKVWWEGNEYNREGKKYNRERKRKKLVQKSSKGTHKGAKERCEGYKTQETRKGTVRNMQGYKGRTGGNLNTPVSFSVWNPQWQPLHTGLHFGFLRRKDPGHEVKHFTIYLQNCKVHRRLFLQHS